MAKTTIETRNTAAITRGTSSSHGGLLEMVFISRINPKLNSPVMVLTAQSEMDRRCKRVFRPGPNWLMLRILTFNRLSAIILYRLKF